MADHWKTVGQAFDEQFLAADRVAQVYDPATQTTYTGTGVGTDEAQLAIEIALDVADGDPVLALETIVDSQVVSALCKNIAAETLAQ